MICVSSYKLKSMYAGYTLAACGQLKSESERMRKVDRIALEAMMIAGHGEE